MVVVVLFAGVLLFVLSLFMPLLRLLFYDILSYVVVGIAVAFVAVVRVVMRFVVV